MISFKQFGDLNKTENFLKNAYKKNYLPILHKYGKQGVQSLSEATPVESGETARSWDYKIEKNKNGYSLIWTNSHIDNGVPIAILIQYGHGTGTGGYVKGIDYINPALRNILNQLAIDIWREVETL